MAARYEWDVKQVGPNAWVVFQRADPAHQWSVWKRFRTEPEARREQERLRALKRPPYRL